MKLYKINKNLIMFIPSGTAMLNANVYIIKDKINAIIDTGTSTTLGKKRFQRILRSLGIEKIDMIILTHSHHDHCANAGVFQEFFDCKVLAHPASIPILTKDKGFDLKNFEFLEFAETAIPFMNEKRMHNPFFTRLISLGYNFYQGRIKPVKKVVSLQDQDEISFGNLKMKILYTPGHSEDSICLYEPKKRILFTGDTVPFTPYLETSIEDIKYSIKKIMNLDVKYVFRSHGYRFHPFCEEFCIYLEFLDSIKRAEKRIVKGLRLKGPLKLKKIVPLMYERSHIGHHRFYKLIRTDHIWALKYIQDLEKKGLIKKGDNQKYYIK
ncbi:MAG: MBL fold metallo-hydrolase [Promethearchaeota archaeon]|nr:MAG: MBL fold metallo-hydrolase [Candidatus Lokiarchaeota archaeon]